MAMSTKITLTDVNVQSMDRKLDALVSRSGRKIRVVIFGGRVDYNNPIKAIRDMTNEQLAIHTRSVIKMEKGRVGNLGAVKKADPFIFSGKPSSFQLRR